MNPNEEPHDDAMRDVSSLYRRAGFDETPPPEIDDAVLGAAARAAARRKRRFRPAHFAWAAAVALSVALVIEVGIRPSGPANDERAARPSEQTQQAEQPVRSAATPAPEARGFAADSVESAAPAAESAGDVRASRQSASALDAAALRCGSDVRESAAAWLDCIAALRRAGDDAGAAAELNALRRRYPNAAPAADAAPQ